MSDPPITPAVKPKMSPLTRTIVIIVSLAAMTGGIFQIVRGLSGGKVDPAVEQLSKESDEAFAAANKQLEEAGPLLQSVLVSVDKDGLAPVRAQKKEAVERAAALYDQAAQKLRLAAQKANEAAAKKPGVKVEDFLKTKAVAYSNFATGRELNRDVARMILDEKVKSSEELLPKLGAAAKLETAGNEASARADKLVKDSKK